MGFFRNRILFGCLATTIVAFFVISNLSDLSHRIQKHTDYKVMSANIREGIIGKSTMSPKAVLTNRHGGIIDKSTKSSMVDDVKVSTQSTKESNLVNTKRRLDARMARVRDVCKNKNYSSIPSTYQVWDEFGHGRLTFCSIPKCGTTFLDRILKPTIQEMNDGDAPFAEENHKRFMLVREPFSRLVSAFFSKMVGHPYWWEHNTRYMIEPFRFKASKRSLRCGHDVTFPEYVKFIIELHKSYQGKDPHFLRIMEVCNVCLDTPDFIGTLETVKDDVMYILNSVNLTGRTNESFIEIKHMAEVFMTIIKDKYLQRDCGPMCPILQRYWWSQQANGKISLDVDLPATGDECETMTAEKLGDIAYIAYRLSKGRINPREQRNKIMVDLFRQVPMEDRRALQRIYTPECDLFGYDPTPPFVFPELYENETD